MAWSDLAQDRDSLVHVVGFVSFILMLSVD